MDGWMDGWMDTVAERIVVTIVLKYPTSLSFSFDNCFIETHSHKHLANFWKEEKKSMRRAEELAFHLWAIAVDASIESSVIDLID